MELKDYNIPPLSGQAETEGCIPLFAALSPLSYTLNMPRSRVLPVLIIVVLVIAVSAFFILRARGGVADGPLVAFCPGPDNYGYSCQPGNEYGYLDATNDTGLYSDDGVVEIDLPFPFLFYGHHYQQIIAGSNGTLQFTTSNPDFANQCMSEGPIVDFGEMISPYWDDLDLTFSGFLETAVTGDMGERIFTIEWDQVPTYGSPDDFVTFEVQLHEGSNDIVFLYQDVTRAQGNLGSRATIGIQSENSGNSLQHSCNQVAVTNGFRLLFAHPSEPNLANSVSSTVLPLGVLTDYQFQTDGKEAFARFINQLNESGLEAIPAFERYWLNQSPQREARFVEADVNGDGAKEIVLLLRPPASFVEYTQVVIFGQVPSEGWQQIYSSFPLARKETNGEHFVVTEIEDLTADGIDDVVILDQASNEKYLITADFETDGSTDSTPMKYQFLAVEE